MVPNTAFTVTTSNTMAAKEDCSPKVMYEAYGQDEEDDDTEEEDLFEEEAGQRAAEEHMAAQGLVPVELGFVDDCDPLCLRPPYFPSKVGGKPVCAFT